MLAFLNGQFVPEAEAKVSIFDRSFLYGDGLFETLRVYSGKPFCWQEHMERLGRGAEFLKLRLPFTPEALYQFATRLIEQNHLPDSLLRMTLSRGVGPRGYSPKGADDPFLVMSLHPAPLGDWQNPPRWKLCISSIRLPAREAVAQFKTCNKLPQILARAEAEARGADEALLLNTDSEVAEAASSNLFWIDGGSVCTPPLSSGILPGVTRAVVLELCRSLGVPTSERGILPEALRRMEGVFVSLSTLGVIEAATLDGSVLRLSNLTARIQSAYNERIMKWISS